MRPILSEVLSQLLYEPDARFTAAEIAEICECSTSMIYKVAGDQAELSMNRVARLSRWLSKNGDNRIAACFVAPAYAVVTRSEARSNGCIDDEAAELFAAFGEAVTGYRAGDRMAVTAALDRAARALANARAERDRL